MAKGKNSDKSSVEKLEDIGLREVSRKTYIEFNYLKFMVNKEFSKLQRVKTLGFVKIIQREYNIDMNDWVKEFEEYFQENEQSQPTEKIADAVLESHKNINRNKKKYILFTILFLVLFTIFAYSFTKGRTKHIESIPIDSSITYDDYSENETDENVSQILSIAEDANTSLANDTSDNVLQPIAKITDIESSTPERIVKNFKAIISPHTNIWIGVIDLATLRKRTYMQEEDIALELNKEQLAITGHGDFTLKLENKPNKRFNAGNRIYLYINNGSIEEISESDFVLLNGGRNW
ncbi:MAG: hypothetical protein LBS39_02785 [Campylobacteraceae bacterium]|jgi:cytoskeletal protein RodZ|nr:hypothetical protein [Campylobacteraceae bacterium]